MYRLQQRLLIFLYRNYKRTNVSKFGFPIIQRPTYFSIASFLLVSQNVSISILLTQLLSNFAIRLLSGEKKNLRDFVRSGEEEIMVVRWTFSFFSFFFLYLSLSFTIVTSGIAGRKRICGV